LDQVSGSVDGTVRIWDVTSGVTLASPFAAATRPVSRTRERLADGTQLWHAALNQAGDVLAMANSRAITVVRPNTKHAPNVTRTKSDVLGMFYDVFSRLVVLLAARDPRRAWCRARLSTGAGMDRPAFLLLAQRR
jgi:hypothetical protein